MKRITSEQITDYIGGEWKIIGERERKLKSFVIEGNLIKIDNGDEVDLNDGDIFDDNSIVFHSYRRGKNYFLVPVNEK